MAVGQNGSEQYIPAELKSAVEALREQFDANVRNCLRATQKLCCATLYPDAAIDPNLPAKSSVFSRYMKVVNQMARDEFLRHIGTDTPSAKIKGFLDISRSILALEIFRTYDAVFQSALAHMGQLDVGPVEWAEKITRTLVQKLETEIAFWIREVCRDPNLSDFDRVLHVRLPRLIRMQPIGNGSFDPATALVMEDEPTSRDLLNRLSAMVVRFLGTDLDDIVRDAHIHFAKKRFGTPLATPKIKTGSNTNGSARIRERERHPEDQRREAMIFHAINAGLKGKKYCNFLQDCGVRTLVEWWTAGGKQYPDAYKKPKYKTLIHKQKNRLSSKLKMLEKRDPQRLKKLLNKFPVPQSLAETRSSSYSQPA